MTSGPKNRSAQSSGDWISRLARLRKQTRAEPEAPARRVNLMHEYLDPAVLAKIEDLELVARTVVEGFLHGLHRSPYVGFSVEFASHREYLPGDDLRHLNWKLYARNDKLYVKQYDAETNLDCHLVVDVSGSMETASAGTSKRRYATMLAAAIAHLALSQRDAVGLDALCRSRRRPRKASGQVEQLDEILSALAGPREKPAAASAAVLHEVAELMPRRGLVVLVSDLFFPVEDVFSGLDHLLFHGHDLIIFHVLDPLEHGLGVAGQVRFHDLETGEELTTQTDEIRPLYEQALAGMAARARRRATGPIGRPRTPDDRQTARTGPVRISDEAFPAFLKSELILAGLGFIHLGFLAAAAAVAVPILIHLLFRPRAQQVKIGTLFFLRSVLRDSARRRKVRRWLLLALRAAGVLLLALLFARPYRSDSGSEGPEREAILLIDRSASMGATGENESPFARAQKQAAELLKDLPTGTALHLAYFDADGVDPRPEARIDQALLPWNSGTDFGKALAWARDIVVGSRRGTREVYLWTDLRAQRAAIAARDAVSRPHPDRRDRRRPARFAKPRRRAGSG